jgi:hypothetical protein
MSAKDDDLAPLPTLPLGRYRHYKGGLYDVLGVARHSETLEPMVLYRALYGRQELWVRPFAMFTEQVNHNGQLRPRFSCDCGVVAQPPPPAATSGLE